MTEARLARARAVVRRAPWVLAFAPLLLAGCAGAEPAAVTGVPGQNYVAGDGTITRVAPADRTGVPTLEGPQLGGGTFRLADHRGKVVVINVWGSWCGPCRREAPALQRAWESLQGKPVQFVGLNEKDDAEPAQAFVRRYGLTYPSVEDPDGMLLLGFRDLPPQAVPSTLVIDQQGRVAARIVGEVGEVTLRQLVEDELEQRPA